MCNQFAKIFIKIRPLALWSMLFDDFELNLWRKWTQEGEAAVAIIHVFCQLQRLWPTNLNCNWRQWAKDHYINYWTLCKKLLIEDEFEISIGTFQASPDEMEVQIYNTECQNERVNLYSNEIKLMELAIAESGERVNGRKFDWELITTVNDKHTYVNCDKASSKLIQPEVIIIKIWNPWSKLLSLMLKVLDMKLDHHKFPCCPF